MAAKIKRELQVKFSTTGDGQVVRSIASVDSALKSTEQAGEGAGKSIADLSESLDKGLENSVGRAFKATDRLNSIVGQVTGAIGLATLAVTGAVAAYKALTSGSDSAARTQKLLADRLKKVKEEAAAAAKRVNELAAAQGGAAGFLTGAELAQLQDADKRRNELLKEREDLTARQLATQQKLAKMTGGARAQTVSALDAERRALEDKLDATQFEIQLLGQVAAKRQADTFAVKEQTAAVKAQTEAIVESTAQIERRIKGSFKDFDEQIARSLTLYDDKTRDQFAEFVASLEGLIPVADRVAARIKDIFSLFSGPESPTAAATADASKFSDVFKEMTKDLGEVGQASVLASIDAVAGGMESIARGTTDAAAAAFWYKSSFAEAAKEAVAALAVQATSEALFQGARALAYLAAGLFTGSPTAFKASATAAASAAGFLAVGAAAGGIGRSVGAFDSAGAGGGGGVPSGPSARDAGIGGPSAGDGGGDTIILNVGTPISTEADIGAAVATALNASGRSRGRTRVNRRAIGRA